MKKFRVKVFVRGTITRVIDADNDQDAQQAAEDIVADALPPGFGGLVRAGKPSPSARKVRRR